MVKVSFRPWEELVVHETIRHGLRDLIKLRTQVLRSGMVAEPLLWVDGVLFSRTVMPPTEDVIREQLKGIIHYASVEWALMPKYKSYLGFVGVKIPVINASDTMALKELVKELKKQSK
jgi:hypothetical protein